MMTPGWYPPREDSPSALSNRIFAMRRINKMEAQRLWLQLNTLDAEVMQTKNMIAQKQQALKKELKQIHEVKSNPAVGIERRKLQRQISSKQILMRRQRLAGDAQGAQTLFRSFSTGHLPMQSSRVFTVHGKERKLGTSRSPLSTVSETLTGNIGQRESIFDNHTKQREMWNARFPASATEKDKFLHRSLSMETSRTPSLLESASDFNSSLKSDNFIVASVRNRKLQMLGNCQGKQNLDLHCPKLPLKEKQKDLHRNLPQTKDLIYRKVHDSAARSCIGHGKGATRDEPNEQGLSLEVLTYSYSNASTRKTQTFWEDNPVTSLECQLSRVPHISVRSGEESNACEKSITAGNKGLLNSKSLFLPGKSLSAPTSP